MYHSCHFLGCPHGRMARGGNGLPELSPGPATPNSSTSCGRATPETTLWPFQGWPACRAGGLQLSPTPLDTPRCTPMLLPPYHSAYLVLGGESEGVKNSPVFHGVSMDSLKCCYALPLYALRAATPETALWPFQGWLPTGRAACCFLANPLDTPCYAGLELRR
jgi:hypothetical protein